LVNFHRCFRVFCGSTTVIVSIASSYVTDIVESEDRTVSLGFIMRSFFAGIAIGPILGNFIINFIGKGSVMYGLFGGTGFCILFVVLIITVVNESRPIKLRKKSQSAHLNKIAIEPDCINLNQSKISIFGFQSLLWKVANIFKSLQTLWLPIHCEQGLKPRYNLLILISIHFIFSLSGSGVLNCMMLYATYKFDWKAQDLSKYMSVDGFSKSIVMYGMAPFITQI